MGKPTVDHLDRNKHNNVVSNLSWKTVAEQNENRGCVLFPKYRFGIRYKDNPVLWERIRRNTVPGELEKQAEQKRGYYREKRLDPVWVEKERERCREKQRVYRAKKRQDPEWLKKTAEDQRKYRAKKKAERNAQSS